MNRYFFVGLIVGGFCGWFATKKHIESQIEYVEYPEKTYDEVLEAMMDLDPKDFKNENIDYEVEEPEVNFVEHVNDLNIKRVKPYVITEDEFDEDYEDYEKIEWQYRIEENSMYDENGTKVSSEDIETIVTHEVVDELCNNEKAQFVYVRNDKLECDFIIEKEPFIMDQYEEIAVMYQEEKQKILDKKNGVDDDA